MTIKKPMSIAHAIPIPSLNRLLIPYPSHISERAARWYLFEKLIDKTQWDLLFENNGNKNGLLINFLFFLFFS